MSTPKKTTPVALAQHQPRPEGGAGRDFLLSDCSLRARFGCKGPGATAWLQSQHIPTPAKPNSYLRESGLLVARLGLTEYLIEALEVGAQSHLTTLAAAAHPVEDLNGVCPVLHQDAVLQLSGPYLPEVLRQSCALDMQGWDKKGDDTVFLTNMLGVSITALWLEQDLCLWCDGTFGAYLWDTLVEIAADKASVALSTLSPETVV